MQQANGKPRVLILPVEDNMCRVLRDAAEFEGYDVTMADNAKKALTIIQHDRGKFIVLMDNFHLSRDARIVATTVFAWPGLHRRVKVVGLAARPFEQFMRLDLFIQIPFSIVKLLYSLHRMSAELEAAG